MSQAADGPSFAFLAALRRRLSPAHRVVPTSLGLLAGAAWMLAVTCSGTTLVIIGVLAFADAPRQLALDTLASLGLGTPREGAQLTGISCSYHRGTGRLELNEHRCSVVVQDGRARLRIDLRAGEAPTRADAGDVVTILGAPAIPWRAGVMWSRWAQMLPLAIPFLLLVPLAAAGTQAGVRLSRRLRVIGAGEPVAADLLRRRAGKDQRIARWDIAFDHAGRRRYARVETPAMPVLLDGVATRGVALVTPGGSAELLQDGGWPLTLDARTAEWLTARSAAMRFAVRPLAPGLAAMAETLPQGAERDYAHALDQVWHAGTEAASHAAFEALQAAAARLPPARIDALLQSLRSCMPPPPEEAP